MAGELTAKAAFGRGNAMQALSFAFQPDQPLEERFSTLTRAPGLIAVKATGNISVHPFQALGFKIFGYIRDL